MFIVKVTDADSGESRGHLIRVGDRLVLDAHGDKPAAGMSRPEAAAAKKSWERNPNCDHYCFDVVEDEESDEFEKPCDHEYSPDSATTDEPCFCVHCDEQNPGPGEGKAAKEYPPRRTDRLLQRGRPVRQRRG